MEKQWFDFHPQSLTKTLALVKNTFISLPLHCVLNTRDSLQVTPPPPPMLLLTTLSAQTWGDASFYTFLTVVFFGPKTSKPGSLKSAIITRLTYLLFTTHQPESRGIGRAGPPAPRE